jgi:predicted type IV restriction endonuclease
MRPSAEMQLLFPEFEHKLTQKDGKLFIFDGIAKKYRALTPEEWVRQHCLNYLTKHLNYPASIIQIERGHEIDQMQRRTDIQVFDKQGNVFMLIECKAPHVALTAQTFQQISQYQKKNEARYLVLTNGLAHQIFEIDKEKATTSLLTEFPNYL